MKYREDDVLVDPVNRWPSQVHILGETFSYLIQFLVIIRAKVIGVVCGALFKFLSRYLDFNIGALDNRSIGLVYGGFNFTTRKSFL